MTYAILLLGVTTTLGDNVAKQLALHAQDFGRVAALIPATDTKKEAKLASSGLEGVYGSWTDPDSYKGFDVVVSTVEEDLCNAQKEHIGAAIAGGVKHFYPAEYGADLRRALVRDKPYFADKISVREYLEAQALADSSLGYTYMITGIQADLLLDANLLGLSKDKRSAIHLGAPDAKVSVTHNDDVAEAIVLSLLPRHLGSLAIKRHIRFAGSTLSASALYDAMSYVLHRPIHVTYQPPETLHVSKKPRMMSGTMLDPQRTALQRVLGSGAFELEEPDNSEEGKGVINSGKEYVEELKPMNWAEVVHKYFAREKGKGAGVSQAEAHRTGAACPKVGVA